MSITGTGKYAETGQAQVLLGDDGQVLLSFAGQFDPGSTQTFTVNAGSVTTTVVLAALGTFSGLLDTFTRSFITLVTEVSGAGFAFNIPGGTTVTTEPWTLRTEYPPGPAPTIELSPLMRSSPLPD